MKQLLNTLYVMTQGAYLNLDHETLKVEVEKETRLQVPLHHLGAIVIMGNIMISPFLLGKCAEDGRAVVILDRNGRFQCRMVGKTTGNVLLRQAQYECMANGERSREIARRIVASKVRNSREVLLRAARESDNGESQRLRDAASSLAATLGCLQGAQDVDAIRGFEGEAAKVYFDVFDRMIKAGKRETFKMNGRSRRPPLDPINALLSFLYTLILNDCISAIEGIGLDPQMGFLHTVRPARPSLGLDLMEEFRSFIADRLALTLINRDQITAEDFEPRPGGAIYLNEKGRKKVVVAYQERKQDELTHPILDEKTPVGLLPHIQARLLARHLRNDLEFYTPFLSS